MPDDEETGGNNLRQLRTPLTARGQRIVSITSTAVAFTVAIALSGVTPATAQAPHSGATPKPSLLHRLVAHVLPHAHPGLAPAQPLPMHRHPMAGVAPAGISPRTIV
jgi:hypothetical protein